MSRRSPLILAVAFILLALLVAGCDNFFVDENTTVSFPVYAANSGAGNISAFRLDPNSGALTSVSGSPFGSGPSPMDLGTDNNGTYLYSANNGGGVSGWTVNSDGTLSGLAGSPFQPGTDFSCLAVDPTRRFVYAGFGSAATIQIFTASSGVLTPTGTMGTTGTPLRMTEDPSGKFLIVAEGASGIDVFQIQSGGTLVLVAKTAVAQANDVVVTPNNAFLYVADGTNGVDMFTFNSTTGVVAPIGAGTIAAGTSAMGATVTPSGSVLFIANAGSNNVSSFTIDGSGNLTAVSGSPFLAGTGPVAIAVDPSSRYVYVANKTAGTLSIFTIDASTAGKLNANGTATTGTSPNSVVVVP